MKLSNVEVNIYRNLKAQVDAVFRHIRAGSYKTRMRYYAAVLRFLAFLAVEYHLENIRNIASKHLVAYVEYMEALDLSASTIKTDLSAIRWFHDFIPNAKHALPKNDELGIELPRRVFAAEDRSWSDREYHEMCQVAIREGLPAYASAMALARYAGLRIHEVFRIDVAIAREAIRKGAITITGKGGKVRTVPANAECIKALEDQLAVTAPGEKLFVGHDEHTDRAINRLQIFLWKYRDEVRDPANPVKPTFHGLRHTCAAEQYRRLREQGVSRLDAYLRVSWLLGHNRGSVTKLYISSVDEFSF